MKQGAANLIINSIIKECRSRKFQCHGCPFIDKRYGYCTFSLSHPRDWSERRNVSGYKIVNVGDKNGST